MSAENFTTPREPSSSRPTELSNPASGLAGAGRLVLAQRDSSSSVANSTGAVTKVVSSAALGITYIGLQMVVLAALCARLKRWPQPGATSSVAGARPSMSASLSAGRSPRQRDLVNPPWQTVVGRLDSRRLVSWWSGWA